MKGNMVLGVVVALSLALIPLAAGCTQSASETVSLKIGTLPIVDTLPLHVADQEGLFKKQNLAVELVPFASAVERDAAMQTGQIDGQLNDLISAGLLNKDGEQVRIVRVTHRASPETAQISIVVGPNSNAKTLADLKGAEVAVSKNTLIEYVTDQLLIGKGMKADDVKKTEVSKIPVRLEMLSKGQVGAATLPEPFTTLAVREGGRVLADDSASQVGQSVLTFRKEVLTKKGNGVKGVLVAYEQAVDAISASPEKYRALLVDRAKLPDVVKDAFKMPRFPKASVPKEAEITQAMDWMVGRGILSQPVAYAKMVDPSYLPK